MNTVKFVLKGAVTGLGLLASTGALADEHKFIVATNVPPNHWTSKEGGEPLMQCITEGTDGEITFDYFPSGQIGGVYEMVAVLSEGLAQISMVSPSFVSERMPLNGIPLLPGLGYSSTAVVQSYRAALEGDGPIAEEFRNLGMHPIAIHVFPPYQILMRGSPVESAAAISGKKIRAGGGTLDFTATALGASVVSMASADLYLSLQQGAVDGTLLSLVSMEPYSLHEVVDSMSSNASLGVASSVWAIEQGAWTSLSADQQQTITDCGRKVEAEVAAWIDQENENVVEKMQEKGVTVYEFSDEALAEIEKKLQISRDEYIDRLDERALPGQAAYDAYIKNVALNSETSPASE